jgi:hypothetical protein
LNRLNKEPNTEYAPGVNPDTSAIELEQTRTLSRKLSVWNIEQSEVGPGEIVALVEANDSDPMVNLTLRWISGDFQPEVWQIEWAHSPDYLLHELPQYLLSYCPVASEMIEVLRKLGLEDLPSFGDDDEELPPYAKN